MEIGFDLTTEIKMTRGTEFDLTIEIKMTYFTRLDPRELGSI